MCAKKVLTFYLNLHFFLIFEIGRIIVWMPIWDEL